MLKHKFNTREGFSLLIRRREWKINLEFFPTQDWKPHSYLKKEKKRAQIYYLSGGKIL
jgi:hypothetical protein